MALKPDKVIEQIRKHKGNLSAVARAIRRSRQTIYTLIDNNPEVKQALEDERESMIDNVESKFYQQCLESNITAMIFFLKTQGHKRGWQEKQHLEHSGSIDIKREKEVDAEVERLLAEVSAQYEADHPG